MTRVGGNNPFFNPKPPNGKKPDDKNTPKAAENNPLGPQLNEVYVHTTGDNDRPRRPRT
jgi:hypothetical protein